MRKPSPLVPPQQPASTSLWIAAACIRRRRTGKARGSACRISAKVPPPDNGLEVLYASASFNDKMLDHGEPVRVRQGERVLFRLLNASPTENITLALPGHRFTVIALDGNPVPSQQSVDTLFLAPAERADVIVDMNRPGIWILGGVKDDDRKMGLGVVVEYSGEHGEPQWIASPTSPWDYTIFGDNRSVPSPDERLELVFEKVPGGHGGYNRWTINGRSWPATNPLFTTQIGKRYRLALSNKSGDNHPGPPASSLIRDHQSGRQGYRRRDERYRQHDALQHRRDRLRRRRSRPHIAALSSPGSPGRRFYGAGDLHVIVVP